MSWLLFPSETPPPPDLSYSSGRQRHTGAFACFSLKIDPLNEGAAWAAVEEYISAFRVITIQTRLVTGNIISDMDDMHVSLFHKVIKRYWKSQYLRSKKFEPDRADWIATLAASLDSAEPEVHNQNSWPPDTQCQNLLWAEGQHFMISGICRMVPAMTHDGTGSKRWPECILSFRLILFYNPKRAALIDSILISWSCWKNYNPWQYLPEKGQNFLFQQWKTGSEVYFQSCGKSLKFVVYLSDSDNQNFCAVSTRFIALRNGFRPAFSPLWPSSDFLKVLWTTSHQRLHWIKCQ